MSLSNTLLQPSESVSIYEVGGRGRHTTKSEERIESAF